MLQFILGLLYLLPELFLRKGEDAKSLKSKGPDNGSTKLVIAALFLSALLPLLLQIIHVGAGRNVFWYGIAAVAVGSAFRVWGMVILGGYYTRTLRTSNSQSLVTSGPYRVIRHPGYLGSIVFWIGYALASGNWLAAIITGIILICAYVYRMAAEERMLIKTFGSSYVTYRKRTKHLIPFLY